MATLAQKVLESSAIMLAVRLVQRGIGLISILILARLLLPADFGIVALCSTVVFFFDVLATAGSSQYLIQKADLDDDDINTAWSIDIVLKSSLWLILMLSAPFIAQFLDEEALTAPLRTISFILIINAFLSPGIALYYKDLNYRRILKLSIIQKLLTFVVVISVAIVTRSYWAQIIGDLVSATAYVIGSYVIHPYRPKFSLKKVREQFKFSQWVLLKSIFGYMRAHIDTFIVKKLFTLDDVGKFNTIKYLTSIPATDIISPAVEPLLSAFSKSKHDLDDLAYKVRFSLCAIVVMVMPLCTYIALFPEPIVDVFLGPNWVETYGILSALSLLLFTISMSFVFENCFIALARVKQLFIYDVMSFVIIVTTMVLYWGDSLEGFAWLRSTVALALSLLFFGYTSVVLKISAIKTLLLCSPPAIAAALAGFVTLQVYNIDIEIAFFELIITSAVFFLIYPTCLVLFYLAGMHKLDEYQHAKNILFDVVLSRIPILRRYVGAA